jgi:hypothetical protein
MTVVTKDQRQMEIKEREAMLTNNETMTEEEKVALSEQIKIRDKLMRRLVKRKVQTTFKIEGEEDLVIESRLMKGSERERFMKYNEELAKAESDNQKYASAMNGLKELVGDLCITPGLEKDYWMSGEVSDDIVLTVLLSTFNGAAKTVREDVEKFRQ